MFDSTRLKRIEHWMSGYVTARKYAGCSVLINGQGTERYFAATGLRDLRDALPFERDTIVRIFSMTKPMTSTLLMMLVEEGRVHLSAPVSAFIPEFEQMQALVRDAKRIDQTQPCHTPTLHQLLTHVSGLSYSFNPGVLPEALDAQQIMFGPKQGSLDEACKKLAGLPLAFMPGTRWEYSLGIDVIGRVIEVIEGRSLDQVFRSRLTEPLGMTDTAFRLETAKTDRFSSLYTPLSGSPMGLNSPDKGEDTLRESERPESAMVLETTLFSGGGGLVSTIDDYMAFARFLQTGMAGKDRLISQRTLRFMKTNHLGAQISDMGPSSFAEQPMHGMGFGIGGAVVLDPGRSGVPSHAGDFSWGGMASTFFWIDPVAEMEVVFFTQLAPSSSYSSRAELKALVHGAMVP